MRADASRHVAVACLLGLALSCDGSCAFAQVGTAQPYPARAVRLVVPFPPGGGTDVIARTLAQKLAEGWGHPAVVDNRPGANGIIGSDAVAKARADGYTVLIAIATHAINPTLYPRLPYDSAADFAPVTLLAQYPFILVVHPSVPAKSVKGLIALARAKPGELSFASSGNGSGPHLGVELFKSMARIDMVHVPYKGAGPATTELVAGHVQVMFHNFLAGMPMIRAGKLRMLAVTSAQRSRVAPELPTMAESGLPGFDVTGWYGMLVPAGTAQPIVAKLHADVTRALRAPEVHERLSGEGAEPVGNAPEQFAAFLKAETVKWAKVVRDAGVRPN